MKTSTIGKIIGVILISLGTARSQMIGVNVFIKPLNYLYPTFLVLLGILCYIACEKIK